MHELVRRSTKPVCASMQAEMLLCRPQPPHVACAQSGGTTLTRLCGAVRISTGPQVYQSGQEHLLHRTKGRYHIGLSRRALNCLVKIFREGRIDVPAGATEWVPAERVRLQRGGGGPGRQTGHAPQSFGLSQVNSEHHFSHDLASAAHAAQSAHTVSLHVQREQ